jgi:hypothetical protein
MIYVTIVVIKADEKYNDECKDNDDVSISMMKIMTPMMMMMIMVAAPVTTAWQAPFVTTVPLNTYKSIIKDKNICYNVCGYDNTFLPYLIFLR